MGHIIEISPKLDIELRRTSVRLIPQAGEDSLEVNYDTVFALEAALQVIQASTRFQRWLARQERL